MAPLGEVDKYNISCVALYFVTFLASALLSIWLLCCIRRRSDPARLWLPWLNSTFALFTLYSLLVACAYAISVADNRMLERGIEIPKDVQRNVVLARAFLIAIYWLLRNIIQMLLLMVLVTLDIGISISRTGKLQNSYKYLRWGGLALCFCLMLVSVISFGLRCDVYAQQYSGDNIEYYSLQEVLAARWLLVKRINFSYCVVWELIAVFLLGLAVWSRLLAGDAPHTRKATTYAMICSALLVTQTTYDLITYIKTINFQDSDADDRYTPCLEVLDVIFNVWTWLAMLCTLLSLSIKKVGGVWSTDQPFVTRVDKDEMMLTPWGYEVHPHGATTVSTQEQAARANYDANGNPWSWPSGGSGQHYSVYDGQQHHVRYSYGPGQGTWQHVEMTAQQPQYQYAQGQQYHSQQQQQQQQQVRFAEPYHTQAQAQHLQYQHPQSQSQPQTQSQAQAQQMQHPQYPPNMYMVA